VAKLNASCPHFLVKDLGTALDYYVDVLGFEQPPLWGEPPTFAMPSKDGLIVMLNQTSEIPNPNGGGLWDAYFWCDDVDALHTDFTARGAFIVQAPIDRPLYGMREIEVRDLDGHILAFASDSSSEDNAD
jgi:predicted enzyme related to lactoylglutathione lyase